MLSHSENLAEIAAALAKAQGEFPQIDLDATGQVGQGKYKYATLSHILMAVRPVLVANGLSVVQTCEPASPQTIRLTTTLLHTSGQFLGGTVDMPLTNNTPQAAGSALTYARRYSLSAILGIAADDDDDAQAAMAAKPATRARTAPPATLPTSAETQASYGEQCPAMCSTEARKWFFSVLRSDLGIDHSECVRLLGITSLKEDMGDKTFGQILDWTKMAQLKAENHA